jgi:hypothetical protein
MSPGDGLRFTVSDYSILERDPLSICRAKLKSRHADVPANSGLHED